MSIALEIIRDYFIVAGIVSTAVVGLGEWRYRRTRRRLRAMVARQEERSRREADRRLVRLVTSTRYQDGGTEL